MSIKVIIDMPLNTITYFNIRNNYKGSTKEWIDYRIDLFMKYIVQCIINQTDQTFLCVIHYLKSTEDIVNQALAKYDKLPENIVFSADGDNLIKKHVKGYDYVYKLRLDSDNVIHPTFVEQLKKIDYHEGLQCIIGRYGYAYDIRTRELVAYDHNSSAFNTYTYKTEEYLRNNFLSSNEPEYHMNAINLNHKFLFANNSDGRSYVIIVHNGNLENTFNGIKNSGFCSSIINDANLKEEVLKDFKIIT